MVSFTGNELCDPCSRTSKINLEGGERGSVSDVVWSCRILIRAVPLIRPAAKAWIAY
jgi:hypothetical protein